MVRELFYRTRMVWVVLGALLMGLVSMASVTLAESATTLHPDPLSVGMRNGESKQVSIRVENVTDMYGIELQLKFDPKVVQVEDADASADGVQIIAGEWWKKGFIAANKVDNKKGTITFAATLLNPAPPVSGDGVVATIQFKAKSDGTSPLKFSDAILATRDAAEINTQAQDGAIGVSALGQAPNVQSANKNSNNGTNTTDTNAPAGLSTNTLLLLGAAGIGILAFGGAVVVLLAVVFLRRRT